MADGLTDILQPYILSVISLISVSTPQWTEGDALGIKRQQYVNMNRIRVPFLLVLFLAQTKNDSSFKFGT